MNSLANQDGIEWNKSEVAMERIRSRMNDLVQEIEQSFMQLAESAQTDALTGLNRREVLESYVNKESLQGNRGSLMILDVDHFKKVNDLHGHPAGDTVLRGVAKVIGDP